MAEQYINIRVILDKLMRHPLMQDLSLETIVDHTIDFMRIVGVPNMFTEKVVTINVDNYRAMLPCDYYQMIQIKDKDNNTFRYTTDSFHLGQQDKTKYYDLTYKIQGNIIYTSIKEGEITVSYQAIYTDEDGYPLIPDNSSFTRALELYIKKWYFTILVELGKIQLPILQNIQQEYAWAVGDCETEFNRLSLDKAESFFNSWKTLIIRDSQHRQGFRDNGNKEYLKLH